MAKHEDKSEKSFLSTAAGKAVLAGVIIAAFAGGVITAMLINSGQTETAGEIRNSADVSQKDESKNDSAAAQENGESEEDTGTVEAPFKTSGDFNYNEVDGKVTLLEYIGKDKEIEIPDKIDGKPVTEIGWSCFEPMEGKTTVEKVTIPKSVTTIDSYAFANNAKLKEIVISEGVTEIASNAFYSCRSLKNPKLPDSLKVIGDSAFAYCKKISDIKIPEKIEKIGVNILEETKFYENLPEGENYLNDGDIFLCYKTGEDDPGPEKISVKDGTRIVAGGAMYQISSLKTVEIPDSVKYIGPEVCNYCSAIVLYVKKGSPAQDYAEELGLKYENY